MDPSSSVEKPVPLRRDEHKALPHLGKGNLHGLVNPEGVGLLIPTVPVLGRGVVRVQPNRSVLVN